LNIIIQTEKLKIKKKTTSIFTMDLLPKVFRTEGDLAEFNSSRIYDSIINETKLSEKDAKRITELVVRAAF